MKLKVADLAERMEHLGFTKEECFLVAVSGGVDSMVLAHAMHAAGYSIVVAHLNYKLRGADADADEKLVETFAKENDIPFRLKVATSTETADLLDGSLQAKARTLRYDWFKELKKELNCSATVTAHHQHDQAETVLLQLLRGSGPAGAGGIWMWRRGYLRPLIDYAKKDLIAYAKEHQLTWRTDSSNLKPDYKRNKVRLEVLPQLEKIYPQATTALAEHATRMQAILSGYRYLSEKVMADHINTEDEVITIDDAGPIALGDARQWWYQYLKPYGFNWLQVEAINSAEDLQVGKRFLSGSHQLVRGRKNWQLCEVPEVTEREFMLLEGAQFFSGPFELKMKVIPITEVQLSPSPEQAYLDVGMLEFPLEMRPWKKGDRFRPLGMNGFKKVSDFLIDLKVPTVQKQSVYVLLSGGEICWVVGYRIDDRYKLNDSTTKVWHVQLSSK